MINVENLKKTYDRHSGHANEVLHGLSFSLPDTGFVCILGASGCGKTSLLNAIGGLDSFDSGKIQTDGATITRSGSTAMEKERNASFGYIFQNYYLLSEHSAAYNVYIGLHSLPLSKKEKAARVKDALRRVDMLRYSKRLVSELSGGQQQRIAIARAIARRPKVIFADEPTGNLDEVNTMNIMSILKELSSESLVIMVTHEERIARFFADRIITLDDGTIVSDTSDWARETMDAGAKNTVYAGDYTEKTLSANEISLRLLTAENAAPISLTVILEGERVIIKTNDPRTVLCSEPSSPPYLAEGKRPVLSVDELCAKSCKADPPTSALPPSKRRGLEIRLLLKEAFRLASGKRLRRVGLSLFIILLSFMLSLAVSDVVTIAHIDPEDFITSDSHSLHLSFGRGPALSADKSVWSLEVYIRDYIAHLDASGTDFDYIPDSFGVLKYRDNTIPQIGSTYLTFGNFSVAKIERLDSSTLICGRLPERSDEIVVDRWIIDRMLAEEGILQNIIPGTEYMLGKQLYVEKKTYAPTIVGIADSGSPTIYMSSEAILSLGKGGTEVITLSEFSRMTGYSDIKTLESDECIIIAENAGASFLYKVGGVMMTRSDDILTIKDAIRGYAVEHGIGAKVIISDEALHLLYASMIESSESFEVWCTDKAAFVAHMDTPIPENLHDMLDITLIDAYGSAMDAYNQEVMAKLDARTVVTAALILLSVVMLYLMQRAKLRERMDLVAVYRLLGIPKRSLVLVFTVESLITTLKFAVPTVLVTSLVVQVTSRINGLDTGMIFPLWAAGITLLAITAVRWLVSVLPVMRLLSQPPARLAAKYDF